MILLSGVKCYVPPLLYLEYLIGYLCIVEVLLTTLCDIASLPLTLFNRQQIRVLIIL